MIVAPDAILLLPWVLSGVLLIGIGLLAWKIGVPAVKIASLDQHIKLLGYQLKEAKERAEIAEHRSKALELKLHQAMAALEEANQQIRTLIDAFEIKQKLAAIADGLQSVKP